MTNNNSVSTGLILLAPTVCSSFIQSINLKKSSLPSSNVMFIIPSSFDDANDGRRKSKFLHQFEK